MFLELPTIKTNIQTTATESRTITTTHRIPSRSTEQAISQLGGNPN